MSQSFTLSRSSVVGADDSRLMHELVSHTGSENEAASIVRSLVRLGSDASIDCFEVTPNTGPRGFRRAAPVAWSVRAVRR